jgi:hypothetical protein
MTAYSLVTGVLFLASWVSLLTSPGRAAVNLAFAVGALDGLAWVSVMAARLRNANG